MNIFINFLHTLPQKSQNFNVLISKTMYFLFQNFKAEFIPNIQMGVTVLILELQAKNENKMISMFWTRGNEH